MTDLKTALEEGTATDEDIAYGLGFTWDDREGWLDKDGKIILGRDWRHSTDDALSLVDALPFKPENRWNKVLERALEYMMQGDMDYKRLAAAVVREIVISNSKDGV